MTHQTFLWKAVLAVKEKACIMDTSQPVLIIDQQGEVHASPQVVEPLLGISLRGTLPANSNELNIPFFHVQPNLTCVLINQTNHLSTQDCLFLQLYLPYALMPYFSRVQKRTFSVSHLTQSLDGKIATNAGHSKWIGNQEDLLHTHCMRALCDAIVVGNNTLKNDEPKLTVRNVEGTDPIKMVVGNTPSNLDSLLADNDHPLISFSNKSLYENNSRVTEVVVKGDTVEPSDILSYLFSAGFHSVFIEGGAQLVSCFLKGKAIDSLQIHIANKILGSGISGIELEEIQTINQSVTLVNTKHFQLGEEILIVANLQYESTLAL
jgi:diaminohydroxyphosphoribosylaminopyrimidine deaminase/5-amino-6-(5-phosphoribosylamino)uracil reductase